MSIDTTKPSEMVKLGERVRTLMLLHRQRSGVQAEMIRTCLQRINRAPEDVPPHLGDRELAEARKKIREDRAEALAGLATLADMLEAYAGEGDK